MLRQHKEKKRSIFVYICIDLRASILTISTDGLAKEEIIYILLLRRSLKTLTCNFRICFNNNRNDNLMAQNLKQNANWDRKVKKMDSFNYPSCLLSYHWLHFENIHYGIKWERTIKNNQYWQSFFKKHEISSKEILKS